MQGGLVPVEFHGDRIQTWQDDDGKIYVLVSSVCRNLGIDTASQRERLKRNPFFQRHLKTRAIPSLGMRGREPLSIDNDYLPAWLANISAEKVKPSSQTKLLLYQEESAQVLREYWLGSGVVVNPRTTNLPSLEVHEYAARFFEAMVQRFEQRFDAMEQRLAMPTSHDVAEQQVMALRITNIENVMRAGQVGNIRVGRHNMSLALEALAGQIAGLPVKTLKARDQHRATYFWSIKRREGWRTTYPGGNPSMEQELGRFATKFMTRDHLPIEQTLQQRTHMAPVQDVNLYPWRILEEALALLASRGKAVQRLDTGTAGITG